MSTFTRMNDMDNSPTSQALRGRDGIDGRDGTDGLRVRPLFTAGTYTAATAISTAGVAVDGEHILIAAAGITVANVLRQIGDLLLVGGNKTTLTANGNIASMPGTQWYITSPGSSTIINNTNQLIPAGDGSVNNNVPRIGALVLVNTNGLTVGGQTGISQGDVLAITGTSPLTCGPRLASLRGPAGDNGTNGDNGTAASISIGMVTSSPGAAASVTNSGTTSNAVFNFTMPQVNVIVDSAVNVLDPTSNVGSVTATYNNTSRTTTLKFSIPQGVRGAPGDTGINGINGINGIPQATANIAAGVTAWLAQTDPTQQPYLLYTGTGPNENITVSGRAITLGDIIYKTSQTAWQIAGNIRGTQGIQGIKGDLGIDQVITDPSVMSAWLANSTLPIGSRALFTGPDQPSTSVFNAGDMFERSATASSGYIKVGNLRGFDGLNAIVEVGTTETINAGQDAEVDITQAADNTYVLNFKIPRGDIGPGLTWRDSVATYADLPTTGVSKGDAYFVHADGMLYIYGDSGFPASGNGIPYRGLQGPTGDTGKSAYEIAVLNGFTGTEAQWVMSLKGAKGDQGLGGIPQYVFTNMTDLNNWASNSAWANTYALWMGTDTTTFQIGDVLFHGSTGLPTVLNNIRGPTGDIGLPSFVPGPQGEQGLPGAALRPIYTETEMSDWLTDTTVPTNAGALVCVDGLFSGYWNIGDVARKQADQTALNVGNIRGATGPAGANGANGANGTPGANGAPGPAGNDGYPQALKDNETDFRTWAANSANVNKTCLYTGPSFTFSAGYGNVSTGDILTLTAVSTIAKSGNVMGPIGPEGPQGLPGTPGQGNMNLRDGVPGTYTAGVDWAYNANTTGYPPSFNTWANENLNNRIFNGAVTLDFSTDPTASSSGISFSIRNVYFSQATSSSTNVTVKLPSWSANFPPLPSQTSFIIVNTNVLFDQTVNTNLYIANFFAINSNVTFSTTADYLYIYTGTGLWSYKSSNVTLASKVCLMLLDSYFYLPSTGSTLTLYDTIYNVSGTGTKVLYGNGGTVILRATLPLSNNVTIGYPNTGIIGTNILTTKTIRDDGTITTVKDSRVFSSVYLVPIAFDITTTSPNSTIYLRTTLFLRGEIATSPSGNKPRYDLSALMTWLATNGYTSSSYLYPANGKYITSAAANSYYIILGIYSNATNLYVHAVLANSSGDDAVINVTASATVTNNSGRPIQLL